MATDQLIRKLARDPPLAEPRLRSRIFWFFWLSAVIGFLALEVSLLPLREDWFESVFGSPFFWIETLLWGLLAVGCSYGFLRSVIPGQNQRIEKIGVVTVGLLLFGELLFRGTPFSLGAPPLTELDLWRGRCGGIILLTGFFGCTLLVAIGHRAVPTRLRESGAWAGGAAGAFGALQMQVVCGHENALHVFLWHVIPAVSLTLIGTWVGKRALRW